MPSKYIIIGADIVPTDSNVELFINGNSNRLVGNELESVLSGASFNIFNLEVPLTNDKKPIIKNGPNLIAPTASVTGYKALGINLLTLANNHILDQGEQGLKSTVETLDNAGIYHIGAGDDLEASSKPFIFEFAGKKIGIYACTEHEFSVAEYNRAGANPFDPLWSLDHVDELKKQVDFVIVLYHGGKEHFRYPSPMLQKTCHRLIDKGADLVICQHSHCIGCEEKYRNGIVIYGQGNFLFDHSNSEYWKTGLLIMVNEDLKISYIPLMKDEGGVRIADKLNGNEILAKFKERSDSIKIPEFIEEKYKDFASSYSDYYLQTLAAKDTLFFRVLNKLTHGKFATVYCRYHFKTANRVAIANFIECEAHRELLSKVLETSYKGKHFE